MHLGDSLLNSYQAVLSPFLMMTSCATLVWGAQNRYSQVVRVLRILTSAVRMQKDKESRHLGLRQIRVLHGRSRLLRNGVVGYYLAMVSFLVTAACLFGGMQIGQFEPRVIVVSFIAGLCFVLWSVVNVFLDTTRSFDAIAEEIRGVR